MFKFTKVEPRVITLFTLTFFCWVFLAVSGKATAANPPIDGVLRVPTGLNANTRYFTNNSGKAIYLTGSHTWHNLQDYKKVSLNLPDFDFDTYLNFLESSNHNFIRLWIAMEAECDWKNGDAAIPSVYKKVSGPSCAKRDTDDYAQYDLSKVNPDFIHRLRDLVDRAQKKGMYVSVMLFDSLGAGYTDDTAYPINWSLNMLDSNPYFAGNNINGVNADLKMIKKLHTNENPGDLRNKIKDFQKNYVKAVVEEVNGFDNVLFEIGNELPYQSVAFQHEMINYIHTLEAAMPNQHPVGMTHGGPDTRYLTAAWIDMNYTNDLMGSPADWISPQFNTFPATIAPTSKVTLLDTDHGGNKVPDNDETRVWKGFLRGYNYIFMDIIQLPFALYPSDNKYGYPPDSRWTWNDPQDGGYNLREKRDRVRQAMGSTKAYAERIDLVAMTPSLNAADCSTTYCLRNLGQEYLVYQPNSGAFLVNLKAGNYSLEWFDSFNGKKVSRGTVSVASDGNKSFSPPTVIASGAVLYLKKFNSAECADNDGDGYFVGGSNCEFLDCNDNNANINPLALEVCSDGVDNDCDGADKTCDLSSNLVGYWKVDGNTTDSSGNINNGTLQGGMDCRAVGKIGQACLFDGSNDYISVPDSASLHMNKDLTITVWIYWDGRFHHRGKDWNMIIEKGSTGIDNDDDNYGLGICGPTAGDPVGALGCTTPRLYFEFTDKFGIYHIFTDSKAIPTNSWFLASVVYDSANERLNFYQNGQLGNSQRVSGYPLKGDQSDLLLIGKQDFFDADIWFSGLMDEVRIYDRALGEKEIAMLANPSLFAPTDVNEDTKVNIKDIQACIKVITKSDLTYEAKCKAVALPIDVANIKDIQAIIQKIIKP